MDKFENINEAFLKFQDTREEIDYRRFYTQVKSFIGKIGHIFGNIVIDDLEANVHFRIIENIDAFDRTICKPTTWLFSVIRNEVLYEKRVQSKFVDDIDKCHIGNPEQITEYDDDVVMVTIEDVYNAIDELIESKPSDAKYLQPIKIWTGEYRSQHKDIQESGINENTYKTRVFVGKRIIRKKFERKYPNKKLVFASND